MEVEEKQRSGIDLGPDSWDKEALENIPSQENEYVSLQFLMILNFPR